MSKAIITIVVAMNQDNVIGVDNQLPWHIPEDLQYFKKVTLSKPIIMGRKTFESIGRILPGRKNIVITRNNSFIKEGVSIYNSLDEAINDNQSSSELCIIGGGEIFSQALPYADRLHLTVIDYPVANPTTFFPKVNFAEWKLENQEKVISSSGIKCTFNFYIRNRG